MVLGKKVTIFDWEWGRNSAPRDGQKRPCLVCDVFLPLYYAVLGQAGVLLDCTNRQNKGLKDRWYLNASQKSM